MEEEDNNSDMAGEDGPDSYFYVFNKMTSDWSNVMFSSAKMVNKERTRQSMAVIIEDEGEVNE